MNFKGRMPPNLPSLQRLRWSTFSSSLLHAAAMYKYWSTFSSSLLHAAAMYKFGRKVIKRKAICIGNSMICRDIWHKYHE